MYTFVAVLITIVWGSTFFIVKDTVENVNEFYIVMIRNGIAALLILPYALKKIPKELFDPKTIIFGATIGLMLALTYTSQTIGLKFTSSGHSAFITGSAVIVVPFILAFLFKQRIKSIELITTGLVIIGIFLLTYDVETAINKGDIITLITLVAYAFHIVFSSRFVSKVNTLALITHQFVWSAIFSGIAYLIFGATTNNISTYDWSMLIYLGVIGTLFCYFASVWVLKYISAVKLIVIFALEPVFAAVFAYIFADEVLNLREILGSLVIVSSIVFYQIIDSRSNKEA
jgi:drug/metabolite transporter (DMT)-like permease